MHYDKLGITGGDLCAAVARALVHDAAENCIGTFGFPQITAQRTEVGFNIEMRLSNVSETFDVSNAEASRMVKTMKNSEQFDVEVFDRIQEAISKLGGRSRANATDLPVQR